MPVIFITPARKKIMLVSLSDCIVSPILDVLLLFCCTCCFNTTSKMS